MFLGIIFFNFIKAQNKASKIKPRANSAAGKTSGWGGNSNVDWGDNSSKLDNAAARVNAARRATQTGYAASENYKQVRKKRRQSEHKFNEGLWRSKHRQDKNRQRRTDWGARGNSALFSPKMIGVLVGGATAFYFVLVALTPL